MSGSGNCICIPAIKRGEETVQLTVIRFRHKFAAARLGFWFRIWVNRPIIMLVRDFVSPKNAAAAAAAGIVPLKKLV